MHKHIFVFDMASPYDDKPELPKAFRLFAYGQNRAYKMGEGDKNISFDQADAKRLSDAFDDAGVELVIDYEHQSLDGIAQRKPAAGWIRALEIRDDGLYASDVDWTPVATQMLKDKEYKYFSPAVEYDDEGLMCRLLPAALTNLPALKQIDKLMNSLLDNKRTNNMNEKQPDVEALSAVEALSQVKALKEEIARLGKEKVSAEVNHILDTAVSDGRLAPAKRQELFSQLDTIGVNGIKFIVASLPSVKSTAKMPNSATSEQANTNELSKFELSLIQQLGVSAEAFTAHKSVVAQRLGKAKTATYEADKGAPLDNTETKKRVSQLTVLTLSQAGNGGWIKG